MASHSVRNLIPAKIQATVSRSSLIQQIFDKGLLCAWLYGTINSKSDTVPVLKKLKSIWEIHVLVVATNTQSIIMSAGIQSVSQFSHSVVSNSLQPHEPQHTRPPCLSPTSGVHPNPCASSRCCHPTISSSVVPFSSCSQSFPASGSFQMSQLFPSGGQSIGVSAQHQSFQWTPRSDLLQDGLVGCP